MLAAKLSATSSASNLACRWIGGGHGDGALLVLYAGPLASRAELWLRFGVEREGGSRWADAREVPMRREPTGTRVATLDVQPGAPILAIQLAVHAGDAWDNGGLGPLGCYAWQPGAAGLVAIP